MPDKYRRRRPVEALQWTGENTAEMAEFLGLDFNDEPPAVWMRSGDWSVLRVGDWAVRDEEGRPRRFTAAEFAEGFKAAGDA